MKKYIVLILILSCSSLVTFAQTEAQEELKAYVDDGLVKWKSADNKLSFRVGGRVALDGAYYIDDYTDRSAGVKFSEARLRVFSTIGKKLDFKFDIDFAPSKITLKDVYIRMHTNKNGFLRAGNFIEPFSAENSQTSYDDRFIAKSATTEAFGTGRTLGVSYRYYHKYFWGEAGIFSQKYNSETTKGDMGYGMSTRLLGRYQGNGFSVHLGGSLNCRRPDANGFANGSDDFNRYVMPVSTLESSVDKTEFLGQRLDNVKNAFKYGIELMASSRQFYLTGEYIDVKYKRERDWDFMFKSIQGTFITTLAPTMAAYKKLLGGDPDVDMKGYTIQAGWLILGGNYKYNSVDALMSRPGAKSLEVAFRFNHTDMENILPGSVFHGGKFYNNWNMQSFGIPNGSYSGGKVDTYTIAVNYYVTNALAVKLNYGFQKLDRRYAFAYMFDKNLHSIQARLAFEF